MKSETVIGKIYKINNNKTQAFLTFTHPTPLENDVYVKVIMLDEKTSLQKDRFSRLRALFFLLVKELSKQEGHSEIWWKRELKKHAGFFEVAREPDGELTRDYKSVSDNGCTLKELSTLVRESIMWVKEDEIIDLILFESDYFDITGRELLRFEGVING